MFVILNKDDSAVKPGRLGYQRNGDMRASTYVDNVRNTGTLTTMAGNSQCLKHILGQKSPTQRIENPRVAEGKNTRRRL